jgi:uncharacterized membrane protein
VSLQQRVRENNVVQGLRQSFVAGLLALGPLIITFKVLGFVLDLVDGSLGDWLNWGIQRISGSNVHIPGLGILVSLVLVLVVGWLTRLAFFRVVFRWFEALIERVPLVRSLYNASRQIVSPFNSKEALPFSEVCLAEYPMAGRQTLGFIARKKVSPDPGDDRIVVFFPTNHLHLGYPVILSRRDVQVIDMTVEQAVKFFVSCGVIADEDMFRERVRAVSSASPAPAEARLDAPISLGSP